jgi:hypothetical protein
VLGRHGTTASAADFLKPSSIYTARSSTVRIFAVTRGVSLWWIRGVKRGLNSDLDSILPLALQTASRGGGHRFDPSHVPQNFTPVLSAIYSATSPSDFTEFFWGALGAITISGRSEAVADGLGLCEAHIYFLGEMRL